LYLINFLLGFRVHLSNVHHLDIEWLLSTLFDASLLSPWAAGNGGSFFSFCTLRIDGEVVSACCLATMSAASPPKRWTQSPSRAML
jgi:hypothetical protein